MTQWVRAQLSSQFVILRTHAVKGENRLLKIALLSSTLVAVACAPSYTNK